MRKVDREDTGKKNRKRISEKQQGTRKRQVGEACYPGKQGWGGSPRS